MLLLLFARRNERYSWLLSCAAGSRDGGVVRNHSTPIKENDAVLNPPGFALAGNVVGIGDELWADDAVAANGDVGLHNAALQHCASTCTSPRPLFSSLLRRLRVVS